jgi:hypothetical protein
MKNKVLAAKKLEAAMAGLKAEYRKASAPDRKLIASTFRELQAVHAQVVKAADEEAAPEPEEEEAPEASDDVEGESLESDDFDGALEALDDADAALEGDDSEAEAPMAAPMEDDGFEDVESDDLPMDELAEDGEAAPAPSGELNIDIDEEFIGDLGDLGLLEDGSDSEAPVEPVGDLSEEEEDELALAALDLAAHAIKAMDEGTLGDEPESSDEEDPAAEEEEDGVLDEDELLMLRQETMASTAAKLREVAAKLLKANAPSAPSAPTPSAPQAEEELPEFDEFESPEVLAFSDYAALMASYDGAERRELLRPESAVSAAKKMSPAQFAKMKRMEEKNRKVRKTRGPVMTSKSGKTAAIRLPGGKSKRVKKKFYFTVYDSKGKKLGQHWMSKKRPEKETLEAYKAEYGVKHPFALPERRPKKK